MVKSVLTCGAETWNLVDDKRKINATEMGGLRRSARIYRIDKSDKWPYV